MLKPWVLFNFDIPAHIFCLDFWVIVWNYCESELCWLGILANLIHSSNLNFETGDFRCCAIERSWHWVKVQPARQTFIILVRRKQHKRVSIVNIKEHIIRQNKLERQTLGENLILIQWDWLSSFRHVVFDSDSYVHFCALIMDIFSYNGNSGDNTSLYRMTCY